MIPESPKSFHKKIIDPNQLDIFKDQKKVVENNDDEHSYLPDEIGEPKWFGQPGDNYPEDRELVDSNGKTKDQIFSEFRKMYGLLESNLITFNKEKKEWQINKMEPSKWKEQEEDLDKKWKHGRNG